MNTALVFGAGKTGRGFAAHLAWLGGYAIVLIDKNQQLVDDLNKASQYEVQVLDKPEKSAIIPLKAAYHIDDVSWHKELVSTHLAFTSVFGNNLQALAAALAPAIEKRYQENEERVLTIITCENLTGAAGVLKEKIAEELGNEANKWLKAQVGFSEAIIFRTCLGPAPGQPALTIRAQNFFELPCDAGQVKEPLHIFGLKPLQHFDNQLRRKIFTYNCINAVIAYPGANKGYKQLYDAGNDEEILRTARKAAAETSAGLVAEFGFDEQEQQEWTTAAFKKFADKNIPDPIERNTADPVRKLGREDRLIGPALLAIKHGTLPEALLAGIIACFDYTDPSNDCRVADVIRDRGAHFVLTTYCGLQENEPLYEMIKNEIVKRSWRGK